MPLKSVRSLYQAKSCFDVAVGGSGTVLVDASQFTTGVSSGANVSFTVGAGPNGTTNRALLIGIIQGAGSIGTVTGATYNGTSLTVASPVGFFYTLVAPATGAHNIVPSWTGAGTASIAILSLVGVDQTGGTTSFPGEVFATGTSALAAITVSSATGQVVLGNFLSATRVLSSSAVGTDIGNNNGTGDSNGDAANYGNGAASTTLSYNLSSDTWFAWGISVKAN